MSTIANIKANLNVEETDLDGSIGCGLRQEWITADRESDGTQIEMSCGAGLGSPWLQIQITDSEGKKRYFRSNIAEFLQEFVDKVTEQGNRK